MCVCVKRENEILELGLVHEIEVEILRCVRKNLTVQRRDILLVKVDCDSEFVRPPLAILIRFWCI